MGNTKFFMKKISAMLFIIILSTHFSESIDSKVFESTKEEKVSCLKVLMLNEDIDASTVSQEIEKVLDDLIRYGHDEHWVTPGVFDKIRTVSPLIGIEKRTVSYSSLYDVLKYAIEKDKKSVVKMIHDKVKGKGILFSSIFITKTSYVTRGYQPPRAGNYFLPTKERQYPSEFDILANVVDKHEDPIGMAELLQSYQKDDKDFFEGNLPKKCRSWPRNIELTDICNCIAERIKEDRIRRSSRKKMRDLKVN